VRWWRWWRCPCAGRGSAGNRLPLTAAPRLDQPLMRAQLMSFCADIHSSRQSSPGFGSGVSDITHQSTLWSAMLWIGRGQETSRRQHAVPTQQHKLPANTASPAQ
jgi:hypothetical protein